MEQEISKSPLWGIICKHLNLDPRFASLDGVQELLPEIGRGTVQRIRDNVGNQRQSTLEKLAKAFELSVAELMAEIEGAQTPINSGQQTQGRPFKVPSLSWEDLMQIKENAPERFELALHDDAVAPDYPKGTWLIWSRDKTPSVGSLVLLIDASGDIHVRECHQGPGGSWTYAATSRGYAQFSSADTDITRLAVASYRPMP